MGWQCPDANDENSSRHINIHGNLELLLCNLFLMDDVRVWRVARNGVSFRNLVADFLLPVLQTLDRTAFDLDASVFGGFAQDGALVSRLFAGLAVLLLECYMDV
jgi:hypothetical protein